MASIKPPSHPFLRSVFAYGVHAFTASGAVFGFLALLAVFDKDWKAMMVYMTLSVFVDGFDGFLARWADTKKYAANVDGALMDNIIDYFTYVVVPALFLYVSDVLPPGWGLPAASGILLASAYQFSQTNAKTDDHFFVGFPSYWNVAVLYMLVLNTGQVFNLVAIIIFILMVFIPVKWLYPSRTKYFPRLTLVLSLVFGIVGVSVLILYPNVPAWMMWVTYAYILYYIALSFWSAIRSEGGLLA